MKTRIVLTATLVLGLTSSVAFALSRHVEFSVTVAGLGASKIRGSGLVTPSAKSTEAKTDVILKFEHDVAGATRPWHIHHGSCAKSGAILGGARIYSAIKVDAKGTGTAKVVLPILFPDTGVFYLSIHESAANMGRVIACGDLILED